MYYPKVHLRKMYGISFLLTFRPPVTCTVPHALTNSPIFVRLFQQSCHRSPSALSFASFVIFVIVVIGIDFGTWVVVR